MAGSPVLRIEVAPRFMHITAQLASFLSRHLPATRRGGIRGRRLGGTRHWRHALRAGARRVLLSLGHARRTGVVAPIGQRTLLSLR